nr:unnamed protein product [Callosobruchus analis]
MAQYTKNPEELEAWKTMMDSMIKFISASTKLMNTINERALQGPPEDEGPPKPPCEVECLICGPTRSPKICQKCAALPAIAPAKPAAGAAPPPPKVPPIVITPADDEPPAEEAPPEQEPPADEPPAEEPPAEEPPAEEPPAEEPPAEEPPAEEPPAEDAPPEEPPAEEAPPEEAPPEEPPAEEAPAEEVPPSEESADETQYLAPPAAVVGERRPSLPAAAADGPMAANCCCEEIKDLKAAARSLGVLPPAEAGEGGRPPCVCPKGPAPPPPPVAPVSTQGCCCNKKAAQAETAPPAKSCCCQPKKQETPEGAQEPEEPKSSCCCAEKRAEDEQNKSGRPCGCGSNLEPPEPPLKLCACPPGDDEKEKLAAELVEKVDKAEAEIQQLRKCNPKKKPVLAPPAKLKRPGDSTAPSGGAGSPEPALRSQSRSVVRMVTPAEQSAGCSPTCPSAIPTAPPSTPAPADLPGIVRSYTRTLTPAGAVGCSPTCPAATSTPVRGSDPRKGPMPPCVSKIGTPGSRRGSSSRTASQIEPMLRAQTQVATRGSMPSTLDSTDLRRYDVTPTPTPTQWQSLPSGNVTICTPSGGPDSGQMPMSDCEQYGCMEAAEEQPDEDYCTDYNCDNEACTLRPKEEKKETEDEEKETKDTEPTSSKSPSKASVGSKTASKASKTSAASKPEGEEAGGEGEGEAEATAEEEGGEEAPAEEEEA